MTIPLFILAGLPNPIHQAVAKKVRSNKQLPRVEIIPVPSTTDRYAQTLYQPRTIRALLSAACGHAARKAEHDTLSPAEIHLLFIRANDADLLLRAFEFCVWPTPLDAEGEFWGAKGWRIHIPTLTGLVESAVRSCVKASDGQLGFVKEELGARRNKTALLMPPRNFVFGRAPGGCAATEYRAASQGDMAWSEVGRAWPLKKFVKGSLRPKAFQGKSKARFYVDRRGVVFPADSSNHGLPGPTPPSNSNDQEAIDEYRLFLSSLFRLGFPIKPRGYHHDAQREMSLKNERFECARKGPIEVSGSHANVYPNDFVRAKKLVCVSAESKNSKG